MASARLTIAVESKDASRADAFIGELEHRMEAIVAEIQEEQDFYPEGQSDEHSDDGIFIVSALSDEVASEESV